MIHQMSAMPTVNQSTLAEVISEFAHELDSVGLVFSDGLTGALSQLDGKIDPKTASKIRKEARVRQVGDPWDTLRAMSLEQLEPILRAESSEVASVVLSKLDTSKAEELLGALPGDQARRIIYAISLTENITPNAVDQIGLSLVTQTSNKPEKAFEATPAKRLGAILNVTTASLRDTLLSGLEEDDQPIGLSVRNAIFTFKDIPQRLNQTDITQCPRAVDKSVLAIALASAEQTELTAVSNFVLENMSKRLADNLRADIAESGEIKVAEGESAMAQVMLKIRRLIDLGETKMITPSELEQDS